ncbi:MAG: FG-GAP repeat protein, partial [Candidatus Zixiibacteriota bacterium]
SGQDGDTLFEFLGEVADEKRGWIVSAAGDVNGDGYNDLIVGAGYANAVPGDSILNVTYVISGMNGERLYEFGDVYPDGHIGVVAAAGDINNDGFDDLIIEEGRWNVDPYETGRFYVLSGKDQDTLNYYIGRRISELIERSAVSLGDINNDGFVDYIVGAGWYGVNTHGYNYERAYVFSGRDCAGIRGDVNGDGTDANILDLTYTVDRVFRGGPAADCSTEGDVNGDGASCNILDLTHMVDRIFRGGPAPGPC